MSEIASAFVRIRPNMTGFKAEAERDTKRAFGGIGKIIGGSFAAVGIGEAVKKVAEAAARQQEELTVVRQAVKSTSSAWVVHGHTVDETLRQLAVKFGITVADLAQGFTRIQVSTKNTPKTFKLLDDAMNISRARHLGLAQAAVVVAKAQAGNVTGLQRLGIVIPKVTAAQDALKNAHDQAAAGGAKFTKMEELQYKQHLLTAKAADLLATKAKIQLEIQGRFGGQAAAFAATAEGSSQRFHEAVNEFEVSVGNALIPTLTRAAAVGTRWFKLLADSAGVHHTVAIAAQELAQGFSLVWSVVKLLEPPLKLVVKTIGEVAGFAGGGGLVAFAVGFKSLALASSLAGAAEARYQKILAAGRGETVAATTAEEAHAASSLALTAALTENTAALERVAAAYDLQAGSALRSAEATTASSVAFQASALRTTESGIVLASNVRSVERVTGDAGLALNGLGRGAEKAGRAATTVGEKLSGLGRGLFTLAGGWTTVGAVALGALAFGIYKLVTAESTWDSTNRRVASGLNEVADALGKVATLRARLAGLKASIGGDKDTIAQDKLNVAFAARAVTAPKGTLEYKQQVQNVITSIHELHRAEKQLVDDRAAAGTAQKGIDYKHQVAVTAAAKSAIDLGRATKEALAPRIFAGRTPGGKPITIDPLGKGATAAQRAAAEADKFGDAIVRDAKKAKGEFAPQILKNAEILKAYAHQLGHLPKPEQSRIILSNADAKRTLADFEADFHNKQHSLAAKAKDGGHSIGNATVAGIVAGINGKKNNVFDALDGVLAQMVARAKAKLKAHSPSQVMREEVGHSIGEGIAAGVLDRAALVAAAVHSVADAAVRAGKIPKPVAHTPPKSRVSRPAEPDEPAPQRRVLPGPPPRLATYAEGLAAARANLLAQARKTALDDKIDDFRSVAIRQAKPFLERSAGQPREVPIPLRNTKSWIEQYVGSGVSRAQSIEALRFVDQFRVKLAELAKIHVGGAGARVDGRKLGKAFTDGVTDGLFGGLPELRQAADRVMAAAVAQGKTTLGAHSPSEVARTELGQAISDGIALGILDKNGKVTTALTSQLNDAITSGVSQVHDAIIQAKQNLNSIGGSLSSDIGTVLDRRAQAGLEKPSGTTSKRLNDLLKRIHAGKGDAETARLAQEVQDQLVAHQASAPDISAIKDKVSRRLADLTDLLNRGSISGPLFEKKVNAVLKANNIRPADVEKRFGPALADQLRADIKGVRDQAAALQAGPNPKFGGSGLEASIIKPLDALKQVQQQIGQAQLSEAKAQTAEAKKHTTELQKANALAKGRATTGDINRLIHSIEKNPNNPKAWVTAASNRTSK